MSRRSSPFRPAAIAGLLLVGSLAFLLLLYALGQGWTGQTDDNGGAHGASNGLNGFTGLYDLLERRGHDVSLSRNQGSLTDYGLLVLTPGHSTDAAELDRILEERLYIGPTVLILPKWAAARVPEDPRIEAEDGWVVLMDVWSPNWVEDVDILEGIQLGTGQTTGWSGFGMSGDLPAPEQEQGFYREGNTALIPLVTDGENDILAGYIDLGGYNPQLAGAAGITFSTEEEKLQEDGVWPLVVVSEPDLLNNYGMADEQRALLAVSLIEAAMDGYDLDIVFDMTVPGLGSSENLLTLAFEPPFLAATLCLILAALVIAWRGFRRFGPPVAEVPAMARGKTQLARNGAALIERARRWHLLGAPYAAQVAARIARTLNIRETERDAREAAIDLWMVTHDLDLQPFSQSAEALRNARHPAEMLRAASALRTIERMLGK